MRPRFFLLLSALTLTGVIGFPSASRAQDKREIATEFSSHKYLFFLGEEYDLRLSVPEKAAATDALVQVKTLYVKRKFTQKGTFDFPDMKLECEGITYTVPAHKIVVLGERPKEKGVFIHSAPDPNGSGNVEVLVTYNFVRSAGQDGTIQLDSSALRSKGIKEFDGSGELNGSKGKMEAMLRNTTDTPFTLTREFFENLPTVKDWPEIVIPPAGSK